MSRTKRARTMKALHSGEKKLRAVINLNDDRFKIKERVLIDEQATTPTNYNKTSKCKKHVTFAAKDGPTKKRQITPRESQSQTVDVICGDSKVGVLNIDAPGNRLFLSLVNARQEKYNDSNDKDKFKEVCKVVRFMQKICPPCRFVQQKSSMECTELSWQDTIEKTIQTFCPGNDAASVTASFDESDMLDKCFSELPLDVVDASHYVSSDVDQAEDP